MIRWKIKLRRSQAFDNGSSDSVRSRPSTFVPTRKRLLNRVTAAEGRGVQQSKWREVELLGHLVRCYEDRFKRNWGKVHDRNDNAQFLRDMALLLTREEAADVFMAIKVLFSKKFSWVNYPEGALYNRAIFARLVAGVQEYKEQTHGEQSEYTGTREGEGGAMGWDEAFRQ